MKAKEMNDAMKKIKKLQEEMDRIHEEAAENTVTGESGGGMVIATVNGEFEILSLKIDKSIVNPNDIEMLEDLLISAINTAIDKAADMMDEAMLKAQPDLPIGGSIFL